MVSLGCPTVTFSLAHRPDLELLLRIRLNHLAVTGGWWEATTGNLDWDVME